MFHSTTIFWVVCLLLLCQCASKVQHQPLPFAAFFPERPAPHFSPEYLSEITELERKPLLTGLEKKRLVDLYTVELKALKPGSPRHATCVSESEKLKAETAPLEKELRDLEEELSRATEPTEGAPLTAPPFVMPELRREYAAISRLWNKDQNDSAMARLSTVLSNAEYRKKASPTEWNKLLALKIRIALDKNDTPSEEAAYQEMKLLESCSFDTAQAGFFLALQNFSSGNAARAAEIFQAQCDPDTGPGARLKRAYWKGRFNEALGETPVTAYPDLLKSPVPGYYAYLASARAGKKFQLPDDAKDTSGASYLTRPLALTSQVAALLTSAEERLTAHLRRDAALFLKKAAWWLKKDLTTENILGLLYVAHLDEAAGQPLEAMGLYSIVAREFQDEKPSTALLKVDFLREMFPRPHEALVEPISHQWGFDADFVYAIMRQESAFYPGALSSAGARGLMQLMPSLAKSLSQEWNYEGYYADKALFNAEENVKFAIFHLHRLNAQLPHVALLAASYNAGLSRASGWWKRGGGHLLDVFVELIPINETRNYVKLVLRNYIHYKVLRSGGEVEASIVPFGLPAESFP